MTDTTTTPSTRKIPKDIRELTAKEMQKYFTVALWVGGVIAAICILGGMLSLAMNSAPNIAPSQEWLEGVPNWALLIGIVVFVAGLWYFKPLRTKFPAIAGATVLFFVVLGLFMSDHLNVGYRLYVLYFVVIAATLALAAVGEKTLAKVFAGATFTILGLSHIWTYDELKTKLGLTSGMTQITWRCDGSVRHVSLGTSPIEVNPGGRCSFTYETTAGKLFFNGPQGASEVWWPGKRAVGIEHKRYVTAQAITPKAELDYMLCPPDSPVRGWSCR